MSGNTAGFKEKVKEEATNFLIVFVYLWAVLGLLAFQKSFLLGQRPFTGQIFAVINALVLGKVIVILQMFKVGQFTLKLRPMARVAVKSLIFGLLLIAFHVLEEGLRGWWHGKDFAETIAEIDEGRLIELVTLSIMAVFALVPFFMFHEVATVVGRKKLWTILFPGRSSSAEGGNTGETS